MNIIKLLTLCLCLMSSCYGSVKYNSVGLHSQANDEYVVSLPVPASSESSGVFRDSFVGLKICEVRADGIEVVPERMAVSPSNLDTLVINSEDRLFTYQIDMRLFRTAAAIDPDKGVVALMYRVPEAVGELTVKYRIRYPGGSLGKELTYTSYEVANNERYVKEHEGSYWDLIGGGFSE